MVEIDNGETSNRRQCERVLPLLGAAVALYLTEVPDDHVTEVTVIGGDEDGSVVVEVGKTSTIIHVAGQEPVSCSTAGLARLAGELLARPYEPGPAS